MPEHILSLSYGKDSLACLGAIKHLGWPLDRIVTADLWATPTIPADPPLMVEFKSHADEIIWQEYGIRVEHYTTKHAEGITGERVSYEECFYRKMTAGKSVGRIKGFPMQKGSWCAKLKLNAISQMEKATKGCVLYLGIAADEPKRIARHINRPKIRLPLVELGWEEDLCGLWCKHSGLLSPIYETSARGGCWFCHNQGVQQLRLLRKNHPEYWALMLKWDKDSPVTFKPPRREWVPDPDGSEIRLVYADDDDTVELEEHGYWKNLPGCTVHDFERRFALEDEGLIYPDDRVFRWDMLDSEMLNYRLF